MQFNHFIKGMKICSLIVMGLLLAGNALAHRVSVFAWVEGDTIYVQSKFSGGRRVKDGLITVTDAGGHELLRGRTNAQGEFAFKIPRRTELHIILQAGMGHRAQWVLPVSDMPPAEGKRAEGTPASAGGDKSAEAAAIGNPAPSASERAASGGPDIRQIEAVVEKALDRKLKPLYKMIADSRRTGPSPADVVGGIGYIIGLVGMAAYIRSRRKNS